MIVYLIEHIDGRLLFIRNSDKFKNRFILNNSFIKSAHIIKVKIGNTNWFSKKELQEYL